MQGVALHITKHADDAGAVYERLASAMLRMRYTY